MNERIDELISRIGVNDNIIELAKQAGCKIDTLGYGEGNLEKFAELIVRECAEVITETRWHLPPTQQQIAVGIKEHFGVEE
jgi:hypothetical protein